MRTPKAVRLKSGNWRVQIQIDGHRYSCTGDTKKEAQDKAKQIFAGIQAEKRSPLTVGAAVDKYIESKTGTLSPSTIRGYKSTKKNYLKDLLDVNISDLTQADIQVAMSALAVKGLSPKTIKNAHGLLSSTLAMFRPKFELNTRLPEEQKAEFRIFTEKEMQQVWQTAKGNKYELPILFASWFGMRMSEIRGVKFGDVQNGRIHVHTAVVRDEKGKHAEKGPKTPAGDRWFKLPNLIEELIRKERQKVINEQLELDKYLTLKEAIEIVNGAYIVPYADITIYKNFKNICKKAGVEPCRFHDLRHFTASEAHALKIPNKYSMKRMGHKTERMLQDVYQHTMKDKEEEFNDLIDEKMEQLYNGEK